MTSPTEWDSGARFVRHDLPADARTAAAVRAEFVRWLRRRVTVDEPRLCDVVLAVNEALANAAEFAYLGATAGTCDLEAVHDVAARALTVTVSDRGHWLEPDPNRRQRHRGRGIPLMRGLSDAFGIGTSASGTSICMRFEGVDHRMRVEAGIC